MTEQNPAQPVKSYPRVVQAFQGTRGERVEQMTLCNSDGFPITEANRISQGIAEPLVRYVGIVPIINNIPTPYGIVQIPSDTRFSINASSPGEAIAAYPQRVDEIGRRMQEHQEQMAEEMRKAQVEEALTAPLTPEEANAMSRTEGLKLIHP